MPHHFRRQAFNYLRHAALATLAASSLIALASVGCGSPVAESQTKPAESQAKPAALPTRIASAELNSGAENVRELASSANLAVLAKAGAATTTTDPQDDELPYTHQDFEVLDTYLGMPADGPIKVFMTGGRVDPADGEPYMLQLEGQPQFQKGQTYVLILLGPTLEGEYHVLGGTQGRYVVAGSKLRAVDGFEGGTVQRALQGLSPEQAKGLLRANDQSSS